jgi:hypothetical protein
MEFDNAKYKYNHERKHRKKAILEKLGPDGSQNTSNDNEN